MVRAYDFVANTTDGVFGVDRHQTIVLWNRAATALLGHQPEDALGKKCYWILRGRRRKNCQFCRRGCDPILAANRLKPTPTANLLAQTKQRERIWLNVSTILVPSRRGNLSVLVHTFRDVTRDRHLQELMAEFAGVVHTISSEGRNGWSRDEPLEANSVCLTPRERQILGLLATGSTTAMISERLFISPRTASNHISNILAKLGVHSRLEAVAHSIRNRLL